MAFEGWIQFGSEHSLRHNLRSAAATMVIAIVVGQTDRMMRTYAPNEGEATMVALAATAVVIAFIPLPWKTLFLVGGIYTVVWGVLHDRKAGRNRW